MVLPLRCCVVLSSCVMGMGKMGIKKHLPQHGSSADCTMENKPHIHNRYNKCYDYSQKWVCLPFIPQPSPIPSWPITSVPTNHSGKTQRPKHWSPNEHYAQQKHLSGATGILLRTDQRWCLAAASPKACTG